MLNSLLSSQLSVIQHENDNLTKSVRQLRLQLDQLRCDNSKLIEKLIEPKPLQNGAFKHLLLCDVDWLTSACIIQIQYLKNEIAKMERNQMSDINCNEDNQTTESLEALIKKRDQLLLTRNSLSEELDQMRKDSQIEKEKLKEYIKQHQI